VSVGKYEDRLYEEHLNAVFQSDERHVESVRLESGYVPAAAIPKLTPSPW